MKFAMKNAKLDLSLPGTGWTTINFFSYDRRSTMQKNNTGMLCDDLSQLLSPHPYVFEAVRHIFVRLKRGHRNQLPVWDNEALKKHLLALFNRRRIHSGQSPSWMPWTSKMGTIESSCDFCPM